MVTATCPVDISVTDPSGNRISKNEHSIPNSWYQEEDLNDDGAKDDRIMISEVLNGNYIIKVIPEPNALPTDTYSLEVAIKGQTQSLASETLVGDIPTNGYNINVGNFAPVINSVPKTYAFTEGEYEYDVYAYDPDGDTITYSLLEGPSGMNIDQTTGLITWMPDSTQVGNYIIRVEALDDKGGTDSQEFTLIVNLNIGLDIDPDTLNLNSKGKWITAYIELPEGHSIQDVDLEEPILLEDTINNQQAEIQDNKLMVKFNRQELISMIESMGLTLPTDVELKVTGKLNNETQFKGTDTIRVIGDTGSEGSLELAITALNDAIELETEAEANMMVGGIEELKQLIRDSKDNLAYALDKFGEAWKNGELKEIPTRDIMKAYLSLGAAKVLDNGAILLLNKNKYANRLSARKAIQSAITLKGNAKNILE